MIGARAKTRFDINKLKKKAKDGNITSLGHAAASIRLVAKRSIRSRKRPSIIGSPPSTHTKILPRSIRYFVDKAAGSAFIGPDASIVGQAGAAHEHGGRYMGQVFPKRPFMFPALEKVKPRLPKHWAGSVK